MTVINEFWNIAVIQTQMTDKKDQLSPAVKNPEPDTPLSRVRPSRINLYFLVPEKAEIDI
jgi:hypothetical protein